MKYLKIFENFDINFPDFFGNSLIRGVKIDKDEYIDDPKSRRVSILDGRPGKLPDEVVYLIWL